MEFALHATSSNDVRLVAAKLAGAAAGVPIAFVADSAVRGGATLHAGALRLCSIAAIVKYILAVGSGGAGKAQAGDIIFTKIMTKHSYIDSIC